MRIYAFSKRFAGNQVIFTDENLEILATGDRHNLRISKHFQLMNYFQFISWLTIAYGAIEFYFVEIDRGISDELLSDIFRLNFEALTQILPHITKNETVVYI